MRIGIVSDSHGDQRRLKDALMRLAELDVKTIIHCGDVGPASCIELLGQAQATVYLVAGNMDRDIDFLSAKAAEIGIRFAAEVAVIRLGDGRSLAATHGDDAQVLNELIHSQQFAYVIHGHTHRTRDERIGRTRVINGGALHRTGGPTVAVLDTQSDELEFFPVTGRKPDNQTTPTISPLEDRRQ